MKTPHLKPIHVLRKAAVGLCGYDTNEEEEMRGEGKHFDSAKERDGKNKDGTEKREPGDDTRVDPVSHDERATARRLSGGCGAQLQS